MPIVEAAPEPAPGAEPEPGAAPEIASEPELEVATDSPSEPEAGSNQTARRPRPSFEEVYRRSIDHVLGSLWRMGVASRDLQDLAQEVFIAVHRRLHTYDLDVELRAWVGAIAWRVASNHRRLGRTRCEEPSGDTALDERDIDAQDPEALVARAQVRGLVRDLIHALEADRQVVFVLHELDGIGMADIAQVLGIPENTGWDRLRRARKDFEAAVRRLHARDPEALAGLPAVIPFLSADAPTLMDSMLDALRDTPSLPDAVEPILWNRLRRIPEPISTVLPAAATSLGKLIAGGAAVFVLGAGAGAGLHATLSSAPERAADMARPALVDRSSAGLAAAAPAVDMPASATLPRPSAGASAPPSATASAAADRGEQSDTDAALLRRAGAALGSGNAPGALVLLGRHAQRYPRSPRAQEREALTIQALARSGRRAEASARAEQFRKAFPGSVFLTSIDAALGGR